MAGKDTKLTYAEMEKVHSDLGGFDRDLNNFDHVPGSPIATHQDTAAAVDGGRIIITDISRGAAIGSQTTSRER